VKMHERSYSGRGARPKPLIHQEFDGQLWAIATSWGTPEAAQKVIDSAVKYVNAARGDVEVTSPFEFLTCHTSDANCLRVASLLANEGLFRIENKSEYTSFVEFVILLRNGRQISWVQCGAPQIFLKSPGRDLSPLALVRDQSQDLSGLSFESALLPSLGLGLENSCSLNVGTCVMEEGDHLVLLSSAKTPRDLWSLTDSDMNLQKITEKISPQMDNQPFWLALLESAG